MKSPHTKVTDGVRALRCYFGSYLRNSNPPYNSEHRDEGPNHFAAGVDRAIFVPGAGQSSLRSWPTGKLYRQREDGRLANILSGKTKSWADGKPVKIILRDPSSRDMEMVFRRVLT